MEFSASPNGTQETSETVKGPCKPIILSIGYFDCSTVVQLNSWRNISSL